MVEPPPGRAQTGICGAKTRKGPPCRGIPMPNGRCDKHGGKSPHGLAASNWQTGRHSRYLPTHLADAYARSVQDPDLLNLRGELALVDSRASDLLAQLTAGGAGPDTWGTLQQAWDRMVAAQQAGDRDTAAAQLTRCDALIRQGAAVGPLWTELYAALDLRRRLAETERRRLEAMQATLTAEEVMMLVATIGHAVREHVHDPAALRAISAAIERVIPAGARRAPA